ncbi:cytochrome d ubiquinol oxidase subunit II [Arcanobacterium pinnipediorum]|uniref:Cytochrome d ubiquinol oxidase subunit II n=1 Tax=Arcanobacterium pinnipediorum TaxID=1503041 RepID=A0ABY5AF43_9ACTO|nr:cytochrome d ubiquinol oxidase subunit II [Arcanobacterium pinnipediorum]USR78834.1 cytochrome d ubiquinol oxidase subunit II [Arcanobacterium pinnipediorum]
MELSFLQILWFILIIVLWIGYVTLEGFGFGTGMLLKILPRNEKERRLQLNTIGPHWDGNEVFLLTAGGATFAAFPEWYATMFSGMYLALVLVLVLLIVRISAIEWRGKIDSDKWRAAWDTLHTGSAWLVALVWGVAFGNLVQGMAIQVGNYEVAGDPASFVAADPSQVDAALQAGAQHFLTGGFFSLFTPFTIVAGLVVVSLFLTHGALWLALKTTGDFSARAKDFAKKTSLVSTGLTAVWALWAFFAYSTTWFALIPLALAAIGLLVSTFVTLKGNEKAGFFANMAAVAFAVVFIFMTTVPYALKSSIDENYSLTLVQASATSATQTVMTIAAVVFVPIVAVYTVWSYISFSRRLSVESMSDDPAGLHPTKVRRFEHV